MYRFLTSLGPKKKVCAEQASLRLLSKAFRCQPGEFPEAPQGQVHMEAVGSELRRHTGTHMPTHAYPEGKLLDYTVVVVILSLRVCAILNQSLPAVGRGMTRPKDLYFCRCHEEEFHAPVPKYVTREEVWLLICAVTTTNLGELPSGWTLSCPTAS